MNESNLHEYQQHAVQHILDNPYCGLFLEMGLGKTISTLTAIKKLMFDEFEVDKVLVIAPKLVAEEVWSTEAKKWDHVRFLKISKILGCEKDRKLALKQQADIYVINRENVAWLISYYGIAFPFDMVVIDELSSFKSPKAIRFKALRQVRPKIKRLVGLTATPAPNGLLDLWPQMYLLDMGERLGKSLTKYRDEFFKPNKRNSQVVFNYKLKNPEDKKIIYDKISDICISMKAEDYLKLPERIDRDFKIHLQPSEMKMYEDFEREQVLKIADQEITALNAASLNTKLLQFANGAVYNSDKLWHEVHKRKIEAVEEMIETVNSPMLLFYLYQHDLIRLQNALKRFKPVHIKDEGGIERWNKGDVSVLLAHPASAGHGLNLQDGGNNMLWFGVPYSSELYKQGCGRVHRQGQLQVVLNGRLVIANTIDEEVLPIVDGKIDEQEALLLGLKARIAKYKKSLATI